MLKKLNSNQKIYVALLAIAIILIILIAAFVLLVKPADHQGQVTVNYLKLTEKQLGADNYKIYQDSLAALAKDPYDRAALLNLGYFYRQVKKYDESVKAFSQHLKLDPYDPEILLGLARVKTDQAKYQEAETYYYEIVKMFPLYMTVYKELLGLYQQKFVAPNPKFIEALNNALSMDEKKEYDQQIRQLLQDYNLIPKG
jgi:tetratricopeptide (TPR) repeat protein